MAAKAKKTTTTAPKPADESEIPGTDAYQKKMQDRQNALDKEAGKKRPSQAENE